MAAVAGLEKEIFPNPWGLADFEACLDMVFPVVLRGNDCVGYAIARGVAPEGEILSIGVSSRARKAGIGSTLLDYCIERLVASGVQDLYLEVRESNETARKFYRDREFTIVGKRSAYYRKPRENALILHRKIFP